MGRVGLDRLLFSIHRQRTILTEWARCQRQVAFFSQPMHFFKLNAGKHLTMVATGGKPITDYICVIFSEVDSSQEGFQDQFLPCDSIFISVL